VSCTYSVVPGDGATYGDSLSWSCFTATDGSALANLNDDLLHVAAEARLGAGQLVTLGPVVEAVRPDSSAGRAGLKAGDVILEIDHQPIGDDRTTAGNRIDEFMPISPPTLCYRTKKATTSEKSPSPSFVGHGRRKKTRVLSGSPETVVSACRVSLRSIQVVWSSEYRHRRKSLRQGRGTGGRAAGRSGPSVAVRLASAARSQASLPDASFHRTFPRVPRCGSQGPPDRAVPPSPFHGPILTPA
jgi:hypothetical protein